MKNALKKIAVGLFSLLLVLGVFASAGIADGKLFVIEDVDFDDPFAPGDIIPVEITLENLAENDDVEDITVKVWIEDDEDERITDYVKHNIKRIHQDDEKEFTVYVSIPIDAVEDDDYTLHVTAEGEWNGETDVSDEVVSLLEIEQPEHSLHISDVRLSTDNVMSGETVDVAVKVANIGEEDETNIKIKVEIPEIGAVKTVSLLNTLGAGYDYTAYLTLDVPQAESGIYTLVAKAYNEDAGATYERDVMVELAQVVVDESTGTAVSTTSQITQTIAVGKGSIFSIEVRNNANIPKTFDLAVGGVADWGTARVDPLQLTLGPGEADMAYVHVMPTEAGTHAFTLFVKDNGATIAANQINVNVVGGIANPETFGDMHNIFAFMLVVFIVIVAGYLYKKENSGNKKQVYY